VLELNWLLTAFHVDFEPRIKMQ